MSEGSWVGARRRALSVAAGALTVALACFAFLLASYTSLPFDPGARGVEVILAPRERPPQTRAPRPLPRLGAAPTHDVTSDARVSADRAALAQMLACLRPLRERPPECPRAALPREGDRRSELPVGGDFYEPPALDHNRIYTRAELDTLVMPPCEGACIGIGPTPPPPTRSAEQVCEDGNLGGPCRAPEFRPEDVVRRRHAN